MSVHFKFCALLLQLISIHIRRLFYAEKIDSGNISALFLSLETATDKLFIEFASVYFDEAISEKIK